MEVKKAPQVDLEKRRPLFLQIGFVLVLTSVLLAFEWSTADLNTAEGIEIPGEVIEVDIIPITMPAEVKPPPPPPPARIIDIINIADDNTILDEELFIEDTDIDENDEIFFDVTVEEEVNEGHIFITVEEMPTFPGGIAALMEYLSKSVKYPASAIDSNIQGKVYVKFVIGKKGDVENVVLSRGIHSSLDKEALRVVRAMPKWNPGKQRGKPVNVSYTVPINFKLQ